MGPPGDCRLIFVFVARHCINCETEWKLNESTKTHNGKNETNNLSVDEIPITNRHLRG